MMPRVSAGSVKLNSLAEEKLQLAEARQGERILAESIGRSVSTVGM